ncbi:hypothetical protein CEXT_56961 [Caerostris extrusa]|uniref:Uncharacterized protein n=1 Tax=Caerostris extrusa TaxID=172846 RepID=A0AAV4Q6B8_CAEEX|nr:hypothetical protein CEXT_56961 [Caerostris extrusa]
MAVSNQKRLKHAVLVGKIRTSGQLGTKVTLSAKLWITRHNSKQAWQQCGAAAEPHTCWCSSPQWSLCCSHPFPSTCCYVLYSSTSRGQSQWMMKTAFKYNLIALSALWLGAAFRSQKKLAGPCE